MLLGRTTCWGFSQEEEETGNRCGGCRPDPSQFHFPREICFSSWAIINVSSKHRWKMKVLRFLFHLICLEPCWKYRAVSRHSHVKGSGQDWAGRKCFLLDPRQGSSPSVWSGYKWKCDKTAGTLTRDTEELTRARTAKFCEGVQTWLWPQDANRQRTRC